MTTADLRRPSALADLPATERGLEIAIDEAAACLADVATYRIDAALSRLERAAEGAIGRVQAARARLAQVCESVSRALDALTGEICDDLMAPAHLVAAAELSAPTVADLTDVGLPTPPEAVQGAQDAPLPAATAAPQADEWGEAYWNAAPQCPTLEAEAAREEADLDQAEHDAQQRQLDEERLAALRAEVEALNEHEALMQSAVNKAENPPAPPRPAKRKAKAKARRR